jgi:hypothetical protein
MTIPFGPAAQDDTYTFSDLTVRRLDYGAG